MDAVRSVTIGVVWLAATAAAVGVSWLGVRTVVPQTLSPPPQLAVPTSQLPTGPPPSSGGTPLITAVSLPPPARPAPRPSPPTAPTTTTVAPSPPSGWDVHSYTVPGGRVVLALGATGATLVSATPADGYAVQEWQETGWLRVDFTSAAGTSTVFATWNGHPPMVQTFQS